MAQQLPRLLHTPTSAHPYIGSIRRLLLHTGSPIYLLLLAYCFWPTIAYDMIIIVRLFIGIVGFGFPQIIGQGTWGPWTTTVALEAHSIWPIIICRRIGVVAHHTELLLLQLLMPRPEALKKRDPCISLTQWHDHATLLSLFARLSLLNCDDTIFRKNSLSQGTVCVNSSS